MDITPLKLSGVFRIDLQRHTDERGFFARSFCTDEMIEYGLVAEFPQSNVSFNSISGTLRGMHFRRPPFGEAKMVRCTSGSIFDVVIDLRPESETFCQFESITLSSQNRTALYVPPGFAHGFQTLENDTEILYFMGAKYNPEHETGVRWDDPAFAIKWPLPVSSIIERDANYPSFHVKGIL